MRVLLSWLREFVDVPVGVDQLAETLAQRGFEVAGIDRAIEGTTAGEADAVIDLEITANRPDCLSVIGMAREVATAFDVPLRPAGALDAASAARLSAIRARAASVPAALTVVLESPALCPRYAVALADVEIASSPPWLAARLQAAGIRPINNVVDVTNYLLIELGHPMHAFDLERLAGAELRIRTATPGERLRTLDGQTRTLDDTMLVIADARRAQAVAGVMGGADSEVTGATRVIAIESAYFAPAAVRRASRRLGLRTEASARFERGANIDAPILALERARMLLESIGAGARRGEPIDRYPEFREPRQVILRRARIARLLGTPVEASTVTRILEGLGFTVRDSDPAPQRSRRGIALAGLDAALPSGGTDLSRSGDVSDDAWTVTVPAWRVDVTREVDLIEEVARHVGYDKLPATFPALLTPTPPPDPRIQRDRIVRQVLQSAGLSEAMTFAFIDTAAASPFAAGAGLVPLANPLSEKAAVLRPSLLPGLVDATSHNRRREQRDVRLFEMADRYTTAGETRGVGLVWTGAAVPEHWSGPGRAVDLFDVKGAIERLCSTFGVAIECAPIESAFLEPGRAARVSATARDGRGDVALGVLGQLSTAIASARDLPPADEVYVAELDLDALDRVMPRERLRVQPLPRHPSVVRDLSVLVGEALPAATVRGTIRAAAPKTLVSVCEFDRYRGKGIPAGSISLSLRLTFRAPDRTLTDAEVDQAMADVLAALQRTHGAEQR